MEANVHQRKVSAPGEHSLDINAPPVQRSMKRKALNAAKSTAWYTSAVFLFILAMCHTTVRFTLFYPHTETALNLFLQFMYMLIYRWFKGIPLTSPFW
jgi:hypothetical protein